MAREFVTLAEIAEREELENLTPQINLELRRLYHRNINRPQLFLTGFHDYFDNERIQLLGRAESEYLKQFSPQECREKFDLLFATGVPGIILCKGIQVIPEMLESAKEHGTPVLYTSKQTAAVMVNIMSWINEQLAPTTTIYGVLVDVYGEGILIVGDSGIGKSETALELIKRGHRLVADDLVEISKVGESLLLGRSPALTQHFIELRGIGVVDVKKIGRAHV